MTDCLTFMKGSLLKVQGSIHAGGGGGGNLVCDLTGNPEERQGSPV